MRKPKIGITMGDPAGIGPEVLVKALKSAEINKNCIPVIFGSYEIILQAAQKYAKNLKITKLESLDQIEESKINLFDCTSINPKQIKTGKINYASAKMAIDSVLACAKACRDRKIDAIVTAPLSKRGLRLAGYDFPGHTELLASLTKSKNYAMMFVGDKLKVILATTHLPLSEVSRHLSIGLILKKIKLADFSLKSIFKKKKPRIGVCALNPHAGENGIFGKEERQIIVPAIDLARKKKIEVLGPYPADSIFSPEISGKFDCVLAMYHDQGLIPLKLSGIGNSVNLTLGLPFVRTSPDHGTALDIAGKGIANPNGMIFAIKLAIVLRRI
ncbi:MAG TPA: 4-hydroxythreonine-4-phosphate dehydrogenase PdxA [candidate division Zixibacteria bacterium]